MKLLLHLGRAAHLHQSVGLRQVLAQGVLSFDLEPDGSAVYSNGSAIYRVDRSGTRTLVLSRGSRCGRTTWGPPS